jgi:ubiquinone biosynthesis protein COQ9
MTVDLFALEQLPEIEFHLKKDRYRLVQYVWARLTDLEDKQTLEKLIKEALDKYYDPR